MTPTFESLAQRVVFSYQRHLTPFMPVVPASWPPDEGEALQGSQKDLANFFQVFYAEVYAHPQSFGLPDKDDVFISAGDSKEQKATVTRQIKAPRTKMATGLDFLYFLGQQGTVADPQLALEQATYATFFEKGPRVKKKFAGGLESVGLEIAEADGKVLVSNSRYPHMMLALKALARACGQRDDENLARFLFASCDFRALDVDYQPDVLDGLRKILSSDAYTFGAEMHRALLDMAYEPTFKIGGNLDWIVEYQGPRAIKSSPFFAFEYDERQEWPLMMRVKCAATNRLVPLLDQQPESLQADFYHAAFSCGGASCGWCKTRKALGPSVIKHEGEKRTICWFMQREFGDVDDAAIALVKQYADWHAALVV